MSKRKHHSDHPSHKKRRRHSERSREVSYSESSRDSSSSRDTSVSQVPQRESLSGILAKILTFMQQHVQGEPSAVVEEIPPAVIADDPLPLEAASEVEIETDGQAVTHNRGVAPDEQAEVSASDLRVSFKDTEKSQETPEEGEISLVGELYGEKQISLCDTRWDPLIFNTTKSEVRTGLGEDLRQNLLTKHELKGDLLSLGPPKINRELLSALSKRQSILQRDEYQVKRQAQVGACLNSLGSAISELMTFRQTLPQDGVLKDIIIKLSEGLHLLADLQFRLSSARQSYIKPCLTFVGKSAADSSKVDDWLFGSNFAEDLKVTQACERVGRDLSRPTGSQVTTPRMTNQPIRQQPMHPKPSNFTAPVRRTATIRRTGAPQSKNQTQGQRARARSRTRR